MFVRVLSDQKQACVQVTYCSQFISTGEILQLSHSLPAQGVGHVLSVLYDSYQQRDREVIPPMFRMRQCLLPGSKWLTTARALSVAY